jgi:hypothetical protein
VSIDGGHPEVELLRLPIDRFLNVVHNWFREHIPHDKIEEWEMMLSAPLPGQARAKPTPFTEDEEAEGFMALYAMQGGKE